MNLTMHAEQRTQQRGIGENQLEWLIAYGQIGHNKGGCVYYFDRNGFEQLINEVGKDHLSLAQRSRDIYAVVVDDKVITVGYRDDRLKPKKPHRRVRHTVPEHPAARRIYHRIY